MNPTADRGGARRRIPAFKQLVDAHAISYDLMLTTRPLDATVWANQNALAYECIVAVGGDGTVHEVINGLAQARVANGASGIAAFGVIPFGSGNDFSKTLGMSKRIEESVDILMRKEIRPFDVGEIIVDEDHRRFFNNNVGVGFDAYVNAESLKIKHLRGLAIYLTATVKSIFKYTHPEVEFFVNGHHYQGKIVMMTTGNGTCSGGGFYITPDAKIDDGFLDICVIHSQGKLAMLRDLPRVMNGSHTKNKTVTMLRTQNILIQSKEPLPIHADGEVVSLEAHKIEMVIRPGMLQAVRG